MMKQIYNTIKNFKGTTLKSINRLARLAAVAAFVVCGSAEVWGAYTRTFEATCNVQSDPLEAGWVYVSTSAQSSMTKDRHSDSSNDSYTDTRLIKSLLDKNHTFKFYAYQEPAIAGYEFKGWATKASVNTGSESDFTHWDGVIYRTLGFYPFSITVSGTNSTNSGSANYYAIYAGILNNADNKTTATLDFGTIDYGTYKDLKITIKYAHAGAITNTPSGDNKDDFILRTTLPTSSVAQATKELTIRFKPACSGSCSATFALTGANGGSMTINLKGNVTPQTPTFATTDGSVDVSVGSTTNTINLDERVSTNADGAKTYTCSNSAVTISGNTFSATTAGTYTVKVKIAQGCRYAACEGTFKITVNRLDQSLTMTTGNVFATTDKNSPTTLSLSTLISGHTGNGAVTYKLITPYPKAMNGKSAKDSCVIDGSNFHAWVAGEYTIKATAAQTGQYLAVNDTFTVTVKKNKPTFKGTAPSLMVDGSKEITNYQTKNTSYAIPREGDSNDFYYTIEHTLPKNAVTTGCAEGHESHVIGYDAGTHTVIAYNAGTANLTLTQKATDVYEEASKKFTIKTFKYNCEFSGDDNFNTKVEETVTANYTLTYIKPKDEYAGEIHTAGTPTAGEDSGNFYYILTHDITTTNLVSCPAAYKTKVITYTAKNKKVTGRNQGVGTVNFYQKETYKYNSGSSKSYTVTVAKRENTISNSLGVWDKTLNFNERFHITFSATNTDYVGSPIDKIQDENTKNIATYVEEKDSIYASHLIGTTSWLLVQPENYKYKAGTATMFVTVKTLQSKGCDLLEEIIYTNDTKASEIHIPLSEVGTADTLYFSMKSNGALGGAAGNDAQLCKMVNNEWQVENITVSGLSGALANQYFEHAPIPLDSNTSAIRFAKFAKFGNFSNITFDDPYINNIRISRKTWLKTQDITKHDIQSITMPTNTVSQDGNTKTAKFYVDYSTCDDVINVNSNDSRLKVSPEKFDVEHTGRKEITVSYTSKTVEQGSSTITIYTRYENITLNVNFETVKENQAIIWQEGFIGSPISLQVGLATDSAAIASSHKPITYTSSNSAIIKVSEDGHSFVVKGKSDTPILLTASAAGDDKRWNPVSDTKWVTTTDLKTQAIIWNQDLMALYKGDQKPLEAIAKIYDLDHISGVVSAERTNQIVYSVPAGDTIIAVVEGQLRAIGTGETKITASLGATTEYAAATDVELPVHVYPVPQGDCKPSLMFSNATPIEFFIFDLSFKPGLVNLISGSMLNSPEVVNYVHINHSQTSGDPDILTFSVSAKAYRPTVGSLQATLGDNIFNGNVIEVYASTDGGQTWSSDTIATAKAEKDDSIPSREIQLDKDVTHLKFVRPEGSMGYHYVQDIKITCRSALKCDYDSVNGMPELNLGNITAAASRSDYITFSYFNVKGDLHVEQTAGSNPNNTLTLGKKIIPLSCGESGTYQLPITFNPMEKGAWADTVTITDPIAGLTLNIRVTAEVTKATQDIIWEGQPIELYLPEVPNLDDIYVYATSGLPVDFEIIDGKDIASIVDGKVVVTGLGDITIKATQSGSDSYEPAEDVTRTFRIGLYIFKGLENNLWGVGANWNTGKVPSIKQSVLIEHDLLIAEEAAAYKFEIEEGVSVTIMPEGGLTVDAGGVIGASVENLTLKAGTEGGTKGQTGYLRISPEYTGAMPEATVELFSVGYYDYEDGSDNIAKWQFVGSPLASDDVMAKTVYTKSWVYSWNEAEDDWYNSRSKLTLKPFEGFLTTQRSSAAGALLTYTGQLVSNQGEVTIDLAYSGEGKGLNVIANSFAAPIDMTKFEDSDFQNVDTVICLFNTGSRMDIASIAGTKDIDVNAPGQYLYIPVGSMMHMKRAFPTTPTTIAPMQGFCVQANGDGASITLDYDKLVYRGDYVENEITPLRAPSRKNSEETFGALQVSLFTNGWLDHLFLLEDENYSPMYESGLDARKRMSGDLNVFAVESGSMLAVDATNSIGGTYIGVRTGEAKKYTFLFSHLNSEKELVLLDIEADEMIDITEGAEYTFYAEPNSVFTNRFQIIAREDSHGVTTGCETIGSDSKVKKFIQNNQLYILKDGILYNVWGARAQ